MVISRTICVPIRDNVRKAGRRDHTLATQALPKKMEFIWMEEATDQSNFDVVKYSTRVLRVTTYSVGATLGNSSAYRHISRVAGEMPNKKN